MTDFGLTREPEAWERPKGGYQSAVDWSFNQSDRGQTADTPRYEGVTPRSGDSDMPAFVSQYLAGEDDVDGIQRCASHSNNPRTPSYDGRQASDDDTASYAPSAGTISTRASSSRPKIAFGRRVPQVSSQLSARRAGVSF